MLTEFYDLVDTMEMHYLPFKLTDTSSETSLFRSKRNHYVSIYYDFSEPIIIKMVNNQKEIEIQFNSIKQNFHQEMKKLKKIAVKSRLSFNISRYCTSIHIKDMDDVKIAKKILDLYLPLLFK